MPLASNLLPVVVDCDPGHDDFFAILHAARATNLLGITTVAGNSPLHNTTTNALIAAQLFDINVPVHSGADRPLIAPAAFAADIHGESGLAGPVLPIVTRKLDSTDAVGFLIDITRQHEGVWLVPTGPLTNIALALRADPKMVDRIAGISLMGGGTTFGNRTATAEFNIYFDPEAAAAVFDCGAPIVMAGLNLTHQFLWGADDEATVRAHGTERAVFLADLIHHFSNAYNTVYFGMERGGPLHDPCAVLALTHPELFDFSNRHVVVETRGEHTRGMTVVDHRQTTWVKPPNVKVTEKVDVKAAKAVLHADLAAFSCRS
jgi:inosine-uridine nucleoside N-ribohydrolase